MINLSYQQKVILAAAEIVKEDPGIKGYDLSALKNGDLILYPWYRFGGNERLMTRFVRVTKEKMISEDAFFISELEEKLKELEQSLMN